ncbi:primase-helicase zinc-binding domain-containing protein [Zobellella maritima]|uniref:primase-helicase zinc-binding domain-containing protein n=1 Tax=Zobellella maritima TaxID=2059725 RepID=UPI000E3003E3|nr:primase-helicase zinc-binding domain-containing protein [Zobellella maritima]
MKEISNVTLAARGQWPVILLQLGITTPKRGQHGPCPSCGGKDRFRFDDKEGRGTFICNQCGAGDGLDLVKLTNGNSTLEAAREVAAVLGMEGRQPDPEAAQRHQRNAQALARKEAAQRERQRHSAALRAESITHNTEPGPSAYLHSKGLSRPFSVLTAGQTVGGIDFIPGTLVIPLVNEAGDLVNVQLIDASGNKRFLPGSQKAGAYHLLTGQESEPVCVVEGLATGLSVQRLTQGPVYVAFDAGNLDAVTAIAQRQQPGKTLIIAADHDRNGTGQRKAIAAALTHGALTAIPPEQGDWDDYRQAHGLAQAATTFQHNIKTAAGELPGQKEEHPMNTAPELTVIDGCRENAGQPRISAAELEQMKTSERADLLLARYGGNLALDDNSDDFYRYDGITWQPISDKALRREMAQFYREVEVSYSARGVTQVIDTMRLSVPVLTQPERSLIGFRNGVFDMASRSFRGHRKADGLTHALDVDYSEAEPGESLENQAPNFSRWLSQATNGSAKADRILAALFMVLANRYDWQLFLEVTGPGGSGKSLFAEVCTMLAGAGNTTSGTIEAIENARERAALVGYSLIILPDQPRYVGEGAGLKAITGGDAVMVDPKHKPPYSARLPAVVLAVNNNPMAFSDRSGGISRRRVIFNFSEVVPEKERDHQLKDKIAAELPVIIRHLLTSFSDPAKAKRLLHEQQRSAEALEIKREADSLVDFCGYLIANSQADGMLVGNANINPLVPRKYLYHAYLAFMAGTAHQRPLNLTAFGKAMPYAMEEFGARYLKTRTKLGMRTNLDLNEDAAVDWLQAIGRE